MTGRVGWASRFGHWVRTATIGLMILVAGGCRLHRREPWEKVPLPEGRVEVVRVRPGPPLDVDRVRFYSRELREARFFLVLKPSGLAAPRDVVILNHGWTDRPEDLLTELGVHEAYARLLSADRVRPALVVLPDVRFASFYRRNADRFPFAQYLALVADEVAGLVAERYEVPADPARWGIGGFSFGGHVALDVARRYMGRFGSASAISTFYDPDWTFWPETPPEPGRLDGRGRGKQTVVVPGPRPRLLLACGTSDRFIRQMRDLHRLLGELGIEHQWSEAPGGHTWQYWRSVLDSMLTFHLPPETGEPGG